MKCCILSSPKFLGILKIQGNPREQLKAILLAQPDIGTLVQDLNMHTNGPLVGRFFFSFSKVVLKTYRTSSISGQYFPI
jgi:hypothetical protein